MPLNPDPVRLKDAMTHWMVIVDAAIAWCDEVRRFEMGLEPDYPHVAYMSAKDRLTTAVEKYREDFVDAADGLGLASDPPVS